jgi:hypothetical protein
LRIDLREGDGMSSGARLADMPGALEPDFFLAVFRFQNRAVALALFDRWSSWNDD